MSSEQRNDYLESKVLTAPPHKLQLMLIEGAIRFGRQARQALEQEDIDASREPLHRTIDIVGEMLAGVRGSESEINLKLAQLYLFIFRRLAETALDHDVAKLDEALGVLEYERQTWQLACEKIDAEEPSQRETTLKGPHRAASASPAPLKLHQPPSESTGVSFEV